MAGFCRERPVTVVEECRRGLYAAPVILDYAAEQEVDLVVVGTHGRRGPRRLLLGSVAAEVLRTADCPVLTVRRREGEERLDAVDRILAPVDFSDNCRAGLAFARELAAAFAARIDLVHVVEPHPYPAFYGAIGSTPMAELMERLREKAAEELPEFWARTAGPEVAHEEVLGEGRAAMEVARLAEERGADLIVLATHGATGFERLLLGSNAEAIVRAAPCPVLTVKCFGRSLLAE
jgi:nucleotide-binding universal stress UspA family protein